MSRWAIMSVLAALAAVVAARAEVRRTPALNEILAACEFLEAGEIPEDNSTTNGKTPLYVAGDGADANDGLSPENPKEHLGAAIEYVNDHPETPFVIYLRGGLHYRDTQYEYQELERGELVIRGYPGETAVIRPDFWPGNPTSWGEEVLFYASGPYRNITISDLTLQGWALPFIFGSPFDQGALENLTIKNIQANEFRRRGPEYITQFFSTDYVSEGYFSSGGFDPADPGIKYQIEALLLAGITLEGVDMPVNLGDEDDANVKGLRISRVEARNDPTESGSTAVDGFALVNCSKALVDNCVLANIEGDGVDSKSFDVAVVNTLVAGTGRNAVKFWHNGEVINSIIYEAGADGAFIIEEGPCRLIHSILMKKGDGYAGTYAWGTGSSEKFEAANSILADLDHTFYLGSSDLRSQSCLYHDLPGGLYSGLVEAATAEILNGMPNCSGNIAAAPLLRDPDGEDFRPGPGSPCREAGTATGVLLPSFDFFGNPRTRGEAPDIGPIEAACPAATGDYDGDGTSDPAVFRPSSALWKVRGVTSTYFGAPGDRPVPADYDGDGTWELAYNRSSAGIWKIRGLTRFYFGASADFPAPADYDGDGSAEVAYFRRSNGLWKVQGFTSLYFGTSADRPLPADYDGDGAVDFAWFRPASALWKVRGVTSTYFGAPGDRPVPADYDGDGGVDFAWFRLSSALWKVRGLTSFYFGTSEDEPVPADYDGDGTADFGYRRPASILWKADGITRIYFGLSGDEQVTNPW